MTKKITAIVLVLVLFGLLTSCGGASYIEGAEGKVYEVGELQEMPSKSELRSMGEKHCKSLLTFNYLEEIPEKINVLSKDVSEYNIQMGSEVGAAEILDGKRIQPGTAEIRYKSDLNCVLDLSNKTYSSWVMPDFVPYSPPPPNETEQKNYRKLTPKIAEKIAKEFLNYMNINTDGFEISTVMSETKIFADVYLFEKIKDKNIKSPNWIKVKVNFWGMIKEYTLNLGPSPEISTKPTFVMKDAIEVGRKELALPDDFPVPSPERVIFRKRFIEDDKILLKDELVWFFDFMGIAGVRKGTLIVSAHSGEILED